MHFHFCNVNHSYAGRLTLLDMQDWVRAGLEENGHQVTTSETEIDTQAINIFWENFSPHFAKQLQNQKCQFGIFATEIPDRAGGFNERRDTEWIERWQCFPEIAKQSLFIWTTVESAVNFYQQFAPTAFIEFGYSDKLRVIADNPAPQYDFSFFGLATPHREAVIEKIRQAKFKVVWPKFLLEQKHLFELIYSSKVGISFRQSGSWPIPSPTRLGRYMHAGKAIAGEWTPQSTRQSRLLPPTNQDQPFVDQCFERLQNWRQEGQQILEAYRRELPMKQIMEKALDQTLGSTDGKTESTRSSTKLKLEAIDKPVFVEILAGQNIVQKGNTYYSIPCIFGATDMSKLKDLPAEQQKQVMANENLTKLRKKIHFKNFFRKYKPVLLSTQGPIELWDVDDQFVALNKAARLKSFTVRVKEWESKAKKMAVFFSRSKNRSAVELELAQHLAENEYL